MMKNTLHTLLLLAVAAGSLSLLSACASDSSNGGLKSSSGRPVNPNTDPAGQGLPGSRATGANTQGTAGRQ